MISNRILKLRKGFPLPIVAGHTREVILCNDLSCDMFIPSKN